LAYFYKILIIFKEKFTITNIILFKRWDICAPEALIKAWGGQLLGIDGKSYLYDDKLPYGND